MRIGLLFVLFEVGLLLTSVLLCVLLVEGMIMPWELMSVYM